MVLQAFHPLVSRLHPLARRPDREISRFNFCIPGLLIKLLPVGCGLVRRSVLAMDGTGYSGGIGVLAGYVP